MTYKPNNANPFQRENTFPEWTGNNLLLRDPQMRRKAGVTVLDSDVSEMYDSAQRGGATNGAPLYLSKFDSPASHPYEDVPLPAWVRHPMPAHKPATQQTGGVQAGGMQMASHYFHNTRQW